MCSVCACFRILAHKCKVFLMGKAEAETEFSTQEYEQSISSELTLPWL